MIRTRKALIFLVIMFSFCHESVAAVISSVSGEFRQGSQVVVYGDKLGDADISKITWDDFEDGAVDTTATIGTWRSVNSMLASSEARHGLSTSSATKDYNTSYGYSGMSPLDSVLSMKWFVQLWVKFNDFDWGTTSNYNSQPRHLSNVKFTRFWNPGSEIENIYSSFGWGVDSNSYMNIENVSVTNSGMTFNTGTLTKASISDGNWHLIQTEFHDSSSASAADAKYKVWYDGKLVQNLTEFVARENENLKRPMYIGFFNAWGPNSALGETSRSPNIIFVDDVYSSPTVARVEIGDNPIFNNCTHREIQIPLSWTDGEIRIQFNKGSFANSTGLYLFVVDADGVVTAGKELVSGASAPIAPMNLRAQ